MATPGRPSRFSAAVRVKRCAAAALVALVAAMAFSAAISLDAGSAAFADPAPGAVVRPPPQPQAAPQPVQPLPAGQQPSPAQPPSTQPRPSGQQPPEQAGQKPPTFRVAANFVLVDVYPTAGGRPVSGLTAQDFVVQEDGVVQKVETFEHVVIRAASGLEERPEPSTVRESDQMAAEARTRLFVLYLDTYHVNRGSAHRIRAPIITLLNRIIGPDDMVAVMTPEMSARDVTFTRRTGTIERALEPWWEWGRRDYSTVITLDRTEEMYAGCYPEMGSSRTLSATAEEMIQRRREKRTLDSLADLIVHLDGIREERKAVITITEGWKLFRPNRGLANSQIPQSPGIFVGPDGRLGTGSDPRYATASRSECDRERLILADLDDEQDFRRLLEDANHANVSFYPVDPRGLAVFDSEIGPNAPPSLTADMANLRGRIQSLQTLAENTDGLAIVNSNDLEAGLRRVVDDLTSYYLLGYYSTNAKSDGRFHKISVRVNRPGVSVRARRGYRSPTPGDLGEATAADAARAAAAATPTGAAIARLAVSRSDLPVRFQAGYGWRPAGAPGAAGGQGAEIWAMGEVDASQVKDPLWKEGGEATVTVTDAAGKEVASARATVTAAARSYVVRVPQEGTLAPGDYSVRSSLRAAGGGPAQGDTTRLTIPAAGSANAPVPGQPLLFRRGPFTGVSFVPTADARFRRREMLRVEVPLAVKPDRAAAQLLDRLGKPMAVPLTTALRDGPPGPAVLADLALAPLAQGDYLVEITVGSPGSEQKVLAAFRIVP